MVIEAEGPFAGFNPWATLTGDDPIGPPDPILEKQAQDFRDQVKRFWPLALIPVVIQLWKRFKKRDDDVPWEAIARAIAPIVAPIILSVVWVVLTKFDKRVDWLANMISVAEIIPTVDLNIPPGIVLGSMYASAEDVQKILTAVIKAGEKFTDLSAEDLLDLVPKVPQESVTEDVLRAFIGGEPVGKFILDLFFGKPKDPLA